MLIANFHDRELVTISDSISKIIIDGTDNSKKIIFLCGKDKSDKDSYRFKISELLLKEKNFQLAYPEDLFEDLLEGQANNSLLKLEEQLAEAVDLIVLIPESPGSFAELGAFSMRKDLAKKTLVLRQNKYKSDKSFINHGPIRLIRSYKGRVQDIPNNFDTTDSSQSIKIIKKIKRMLPAGRIKKNIDNILLYQHHLLLLIYLFDNATLHILTKMLGMVLKRNLVNDDYDACRAALHGLVRTSMIEKNNEIYTIRKNGFDDISTRYYSINEINSLRIKIMNKQLSRQN